MRDLIGETSLGVCVSGALFIGVLFYIFVLNRRQNDSGPFQEPPYIRSWIPFVGHIIGMARWGAKYFEIVKYVYR